MKDLGVSEYSVMIHDVGPDKKARIKSLFNYMQTNIDDHARQQGTSVKDFESYNLSWVYARFYAEVREYPELHQKIICRTWRSRLEKYLAYRDFTISDESGNVMLAATASLALINKDTRRPIEIKVPSSMHFETHGERSVDYMFDRIPELDSYGKEYRTLARFEDIDINNHMNNASYAQMFYEGLAGELPGSRLYSIDIAFRGEVSLRDELICMSGLASEGIWYHKLMNSTKGSVSAMAVTRWL